MVIPRETTLASLANCMNYDPFLSYQTSLKEIGCEIWLTDACRINEIYENINSGQLSKRPAGVAKDMYGSHS